MRSSRDVGRGAILKILERANERASEREGGSEWVITRTNRCGIARVCRRRVLLSFRFLPASLLLPFFVVSRPGSVMGMHFFSPAHMMPLVECIRGEDSSPTTIAVVMGITKRLKKVRPEKRRKKKKTRSFIDLPFSHVEKNNFSCVWDLEGFVENQLCTYWY